MSNGDSGSDQEQALQFGTNFTVNLSQIALTAEQRDAISKEIISVIIARIGRIPPDIIDVGSAAWSATSGLEGIWKKYGRYM